MGRWFLCVVAHPETETSPWVGLILWGLNTSTCVRFHSSDQWRFEIFHSEVLKWWTESLWWLSALSLSSIHPILDQRTISEFLILSFNEGAEAIGGLPQCSVPPRDHMQRLHFCLPPRFDWKDLRKFLIKVGINLSLLNTLAWLSSHFVTETSCWSWQ